jgi:CheY-like chemotaxis protein
MGGNLEVDSIPGEGTTVYCPLYFDEPEQLPDSPPAPEAKSYPVMPLDILVVEDDPVNQFTLRTMLRQAGHNSVCVENGRQAIEALLLRSFACVITDIQMPVMDGVELMARIRSGNTAGIEPGPLLRALPEMAGEEGKARAAIAEDIPIVALTAHAVAGDRDRFLDMGMDYYLAKPVIASDLSAVLEHIGRRRRAAHNGR